MSVSSTRQWETVEAKANLVVMVVAGNAQRVDGHTTLNVSGLIRNVQRADRLKILQ